MCQALIDRNSTSSTQYKVSLPRLTISAFTSISRLSNARLFWLRVVRMTFEIISKSSGYEDDFFQSTLVKTAIDFGLRWFESKPK